MSRRSNIEVGQCPDCVLIKPGEVLNTIKEVVAKKIDFGVFPPMWTVVQCRGVNVQKNLKG